MIEKNQKAIKILTKIHKEADQAGNPNWIVSKKTGQFLNKSVTKYNVKTVLEIGTSIGYSGIWIAEALSHINGKLFTVESNEERYFKAEHNFKESGLSDYIIQIHGHAPEDVDLNEEIDMLFLDATKKEYVRFLKSFLPFMKKGGIIVADNAISHEEELAEYKEFIFASKNLKSELIEIGAGLYFSIII